MSTMQRSVALVGARGHVGAELLPMLRRHPELRLDCVVSRELAGQPVFAEEQGLRYQALAPDALAARGCDIVILALPNGLAPAYVAEIESHKPDTLIIDLSADHRFHPRWHYGLPELRDAHLGEALVDPRRIANPGCYATAMQLAIAPLLGLLRGPVQCFGVSGYSGAGTTPSDKNDVDKLRDNLMPYQLIGHVHEREVSRHLHPVEFLPHVAAHFRGITLTANLHLHTPLSAAELQQRYTDFFAPHPHIRIQSDAPWVSAIAGDAGAMIGGFSVDADGRRAAVVCCLDNLLKGAASQAMQNLNLACGLDQWTGVRV